MGLHVWRSWLSLGLLSIFLFSCAIAQKGDDGRSQGIPGPDRQLSFSQEETGHSEEADRLSRQARPGKTTDSRKDAGRRVRKRNGETSLRRRLRLISKNRLRDTLRGPEGEQSPRQPAPCRAAAERAAKSECKVSQEPAAAIHAANAADEPSAASQRASVQDRGLNAGAL